MCYQMHILDYDEEMVPVEVLKDELTPYQRNIVENNINLVYACVHREIHGTWKFASWDDLSQTGFVAQRGSSSALMRISASSTH